MSDTCRASVGHVFVHDMYPTRTRPHWARVRASQLPISLEISTCSIKINAKLCLFLVFRFQYISQDYDDIISMLQVITLYVQTSKEGYAKKYTS